MKISDKFRGIGLAAGLAVPHVILPLRVKLFFFALFILFYFWFAASFCPPSCPALGPSLPAGLAVGCLLLDKERPPACICTPRHSEVAKWNHHDCPISSFCKAESMSCVPPAPGHACWCSLVPIASEKRWAKVVPGSLSGVGRSYETRNLVLEISRRRPLMHKQSIMKKEEGIVWYWNRRFEGTTR
jgi:hypothetical protein